MKVTFILKNLTDAFYHGNGESITGLLNLEPRTQFDKLAKCAVGDLKHIVKMKIGNDSFRDKVELNQILRNPVRVTSKLEPRKGYNLMTFEFITGAA